MNYCTEEAIDCWTLHDQRTINYSKLGGSFTRQIRSPGDDLNSHFHKRENDKTRKSLRDIKLTM